MSERARKEKLHTDSIHWQRRGPTPEEAGLVVVEGVIEVSEVAREFSKRFNERYRETLRKLADS